MSANTNDQPSRQPSIYINPHAKPSSAQINPPPDAQSIISFHKSLPGYAPTPLIPIPAVLLQPERLKGSEKSKAELPKVFVKLESPRFTLPSFKILGASYAIHRLLCQCLSLPLGVKFPDGLIQPARDAGISLVTASEGNWGRAVAHTAALLCVTATVYVPSNMDGATRKRIESESSSIRCVDAHGDYDTALARVKAHTKRDERALMVLDTSWAGYDDFPRWVTQGYETSMNEVDRQIEELMPGRKVTHAFVAVGVGSWAHGVISHYKGQAKGMGAHESARIIAVEPTTAACLRISLMADEIRTIQTEDTIMCGMNCGTVSELAWPVMHDGVDTSVIVNDWEAHVAVEDLASKSLSLQVGPCGAATLSALKKILWSEDETNKVLGLSGESLIVLFATEGARPYEVPEKE